MGLLLSIIFFILAFIYILAFTPVLLWFSKEIKTPYTYRVKSCPRVSKSLFKKLYQKHRPANIVPHFMKFGESYAVFFENPHEPEDYVFFPLARVEATNNPYTLSFHYSSGRKALTVDLRSSSWVVTRTI